RREGTFPAFCRSARDVGGNARLGKDGGAGEKPTHEDDREASHREERVAKVAGERKPLGFPGRAGGASFASRVRVAVRVAGHLPRALRLTMFPAMDLQHTVRCLVRGVPHIFLGGVPAERAGDDRLALRKLGLTPTGRPALYSDAFTEGAQIPKVHTAAGEGTPPPLRWDSPPPAARSLALLVEDPDAPTPNPFVHWIVTNISPVAATIEQARSTGA